MVGVAVFAGVGDGGRGLEAAAAGGAVGSPGGAEAGHGRCGLVGVCGSHGEMAVTRATVVNAGSVLICTREVIDLGNKRSRDNARDGVACDELDVSTKKYLDDSPWVYKFILIPTDL